ncbi:unnamed protein product [Chironomus riparius]|uniref:Uncharacterized protein n=1 Tax=Chironomus riparius TaxID=315576 RepID=A0A9N9S3J0_9DIPT|nr:unnamed protein product [Chironomus riparius]
MEHSQLINKNFGLNTSRRILDSIDYLCLDFSLNPAQCQSHTGLVLDF